MATAARTRSATDYIACNVAARRYGIPRHSITTGALLGRIRTLVTGDNKILFHAGDVEQLAAEQHRSTQAHADTRPACA